ncbi:MAG: F420-0--gamma-glutamyl ligase, partial [Erysipelothrix sp.]|nr:F420-0--gamma-glutamyl ligase [Erysipelothrix sp.]
MKEFKANEGKQLIIESKGKKYVRIPLKTHVIYSDDKVIDIVSDYTKDVY